MSDSCILPRIFSNSVVLGYLTVHPDYQRQGVGSLLLESGIKAAEKMELDIFVTSTKAGNRLYYKAGFTLLAEINGDNSQVSGDGEYQAYFAKYVQQ